MLESQETFRERAKNYLQQVKDDQVREFAAKVGSLKAALLSETESATQIICDRNLSEFCGQFELQVERCFQGVAEHLATPIGV